MLTNTSPQAHQGVGPHVWGFLFAYLLVLFCFLFAFVCCGGLNLDRKFFSLGKSSVYLDIIDFGLNDNANKDTMVLVESLNF